MIISCLNFLFLAGKFDYNVDRARKIISVNVSNFLRDQDYYVRLCHKWFTCEDVGAFAVIKGKESLKSVSLKYSQLLPCLCIEVTQSGIWYILVFLMEEILSGSCAKEGGKICRKSL